MQKSPDNTLVEESYDLLRISFSPVDWAISIDISICIIALLIILLILGWWLTRHKVKRYKLVKLNISLGKIGTAEFAPNEQDIQIAHKIWTELITRKAAIPIDPEHDVIVEIYDSWYSLFGRVRELISELPGRLVREDSATQNLITIATDSLNNGLRPHLTKWQARFRNWYSLQKTALETKTPQEVQREYPEYDDLMEDLRRVNTELIQYAGELQKLVRGK